MRNVLVLSVGLLMAAAPLPGDAQAQFRMVSITVRVDDHKPNGAAWDVAGGAPDVVIITRTALGVFESGRCQDSFSCSFTSRVPAVGPINITTWDVDIAANDVIGNCMVSPPFTGRCGSATIAVR
jgi:hypothetical protein